MNSLPSKGPFGRFQNPLIWGAGSIAVIATPARRAVERMYNQPNIAGRINPFLRKIPGAVHVHQVKELDPLLGRNPLYDALAWHLSENMKTSNNSCQLFLKVDTETGTDKLHLCAKPNVYVHMSGFTVRLQEIDPPANGMSFEKTPRERIFEVLCPAGSQAKIREKMAEIVAAHQAEKEIKLWVPVRRGYSGWRWQEIPFRHPMLLENVQMPDAMRCDIRHIISNFQNNKDWYSKLGAVWKTGFFLHGLPGTGKSSLAAALANELRCDVYNLSLTDLTDDGLISLNTQMKGRGIVLIEDADTYPVLLKRSEHTSSPDGQADMELEHPGSTKLKAKKDGLQLSTVLNVMDGILSTGSTGRVFVMTTNHRDKLDPALYRAGRLDHHFKMDRSSLPEIVSSFKAYPRLSTAFFDKLNDASPQLKRLLDDGLQMSYVKSKIQKHAPTPASLDDFTAGKALDEILEYQPS